MPKQMNRLVIALMMASTLTTTAVLAQTTKGRWTLYPAQEMVFTTAVQQPINLDGTSVFMSNGKAVIPIKFALLSEPRPVILRSIGSDTDTSNEYSYLRFVPKKVLTFADIATLSAVYSFSQGDCHGGALRWSVGIDTNGDGDEDGNVFVYYGASPNFTDCTSDGPSANQSGLNMINSPDLRYDLTQVGGAFYRSYADAVAIVGNGQVTGVSLVLDGGWGGDQELTLDSVTVNDNTFIPGSGSAPTCALPLATIQISKISVDPAGLVSGPVAIQSSDSDPSFRIVDCKYIYNLATSSLSGSGQYQVDVLIGGIPVAGAAYFTLR
jgi:hypothetical protein